MAFGLSASFLEVKRQPNNPLFEETLIEESTFCITSAITVLWLHRRTSKILKNNKGFLIAFLIQFARLCLAALPSVIIV